MTNHIVRSSLMPLGIWVDGNGLSVNLAHQDARGFIKACYHIITQIEGTNEMNEPVIGDIHPGITEYLAYLAKPKG